MDRPRNKSCGWPYVPVIGGSFGEKEWGQAYFIVNNRNIDFDKQIVTGYSPIEPIVEYASKHFIY